MFLVFLSFTDFFPHSSFTRLTVCFYHIYVQQQSYS